MWLANLTAALDLDEESPPGDEMHEAGRVVDPNTPDATLVGEISKFGGTLLSEGAGLLQEMNHHVFSGAVVDMLAPDSPARAGGPKKTPPPPRMVAEPRGVDAVKGWVPRTIGLVGNDTKHIAEIARCLAQSGHNLAVVGPSAIAAAAASAFNTCANREGHSIGVMPEAHLAVYRRERHYMSEVEAPVFVQPRAVLRTLLFICDVVVILGDDPKVMGELSRLRGAGPVAVRLAHAHRRTSATPFLGSTVRSVGEVLEHVEQLLLATHCGAEAAALEDAVVDDLVCVEANTKDGMLDDDFGTYEVVDFGEAR
mmetsp:Transcript_645/g.2086  ORF Transcript_645/g.2086 Transcript_645/m.2086 type:complete len:311 (-) Transcript_645:148-1080(-)